MKKGCVSSVASLVAFVILGAVLWVVFPPQKPVRVKTKESAGTVAPLPQTVLPSTPAPVPQSPDPVAHQTAVVPSVVAQVPAPTPHRPTVPYSYGSKVRLITEKSIFLASGGKQKLVPGTEATVRGSSGDMLTLEVMGETFNMKRADVQAESE